MHVAMIAVAAVIAALVALKLWAAIPRRVATASPSRPAGFSFSSLAVDIDDEVAKAEKWWAHLRYMLLFWVAAFFSAILLMLDFHFGYSRGGLGGLIVLGSLFAAADVAIPIIAMQMETAAVVGSEVARRSRPVMGWVLIVGCTVMSCIVVIGSTAELSTVIGAAKDVEAIDYKSTIANIAAWEAERDKIPVDRGFKALDGLAKSAEEAAEREAGRVRCGQKCEALKKEATDLRARANDARRKEELIGKVEAAKKSLEGQASSGVRLDSDPLATALEAMTLGYLAKAAVQRYAASVIGVILVALVTLVWIIVADNLAHAIAREKRRRGAIADDARANLGLTRKYTVEEPAGLLPQPQSTTAAQDGITINIAAESMRRRYANDTALLETDRLFDTLMDAAEGGIVPFAALYRAYQIAVLTRDPNARYMTLPTMASKLIIIAQNRDDVTVTADGQIVGWILKPADQRKLEGTSE